MKKSNSVEERWVLMANAQVPSVSPNPSSSDDGRQTNKYNKDYVNNEAVEDVSEKSSNYSEKESDSDWEGDSDDEFQKASKNPWPKKVARKKSGNLANFLKPNLNSRSWHFHFQEAFT